MAEGHIYWVHIRNWQAITVLATIDIDLEDRMTVAQQNPKNGFAGLAILLAVLAMAGTCVTQTSRPAKSAAPKTKSAPPPFACPDPEAKKACKSYEELVKAKDAGLPAGGYAWFRKDSDDFFVVSFTHPYFPKHWNPELKTMEVDPEATRRGFRVRAQLPGRSANVGHNALSSV